MGGGGLKVVEEEEENLTGGGREGGGGFEEKSATRSNDGKRGEQSGSWFRQRFVGEAEGGERVILTGETRPSRFFERSRRIVPVLLL